MCKCCDPNDSSDDCRNSPPGCDFNKPENIFFCGNDEDDAAVCDDDNQCPGGTNGECPWGQKCYAVTECKTSFPGNRYCADNVFAAAACKPDKSCRTNSDCPDDTSCYTVDRCNLTGTAGNGFYFCGTSDFLASQCLPGTECISDQDCPGIQNCHEISKCPDKSTPVPTIPPTTQPDYNGYCGKTESAAGACDPATSCRFNTDCPYGTSCFNIDSCDFKVDGNFFCGKSQFTASQCLPGSECISDQDCPGTQNCREVKDCKEPYTPSPTVTPGDNRYCGTTKSEAGKCDPGASCLFSSDCPFGYSCYNVDTCKPPNQFCGTSALAATSCKEGSKCVSKSDCPDGQECFEVNCKGTGNYFCGFSTYSASQCAAGSECSSDLDCPGSQQCREITKCRAPPTPSPTSMPTPKPRTTLSIDYLLCLEHGILTSPKKLTKRTQSEITSILDEKFIDNQMDIDTKWDVDETHLRVDNVASEFLAKPPDGFQCKFRKLIVLLLIRCSFSDIL
jgi:hypothetical protein